MTTTRRPRSRFRSDAEPGGGAEAGSGAELDPPGDPESVARIVCLRLLERRARSRQELADALRSRDVPDDAAGRVLDRFVEVGLIDDAALAQSVTGAAQLQRGLARRAVAQKLRQRGVPDDVVAETLDAVDPAGERARAEQLVARRRRALAALPPEVQGRRLVGLLARKGYPSGMAYEVVRAELANTAVAGSVEDAEP